jgi:hypothetical protein
MKHEHVSPRRDRTPRLAADAAAGGGKRTDVSFAPLAEWKEIDKFDSKAECEHMRKALIKRIPQTAIDTTRCVPTTTRTYIAARKLHQLSAVNIMPSL